MLGLLQGLSQKVWVHASPKQHFQNLRGFSNPLYNSKGWFFSMNCHFSMIKTSSKIYLLVRQNPLILIRKNGIDTKVLDLPLVPVSQTPCWGRSQSDIIWGIRVWNRHVHSFDFWFMSREKFGSIVIWGIVDMVPCTYLTFYFNQHPSSLSGGLAV